MKIELITRDSGLASTLSIPAKRVADVGPKSREAAQWAGSSSHIYAYEIEVETIAQLRDASKGLHFTWESEHGERGLRDNLRWEHEGVEKIDDNPKQPDDWKYRTPGCGMMSSL